MIGLLVALFLGLVMGWVAYDVDLFRLQSKFRKFQNKRVVAGIALPPHDGEMHVCVYPKLGILSETEVTALLGRLSVDWGGLVTATQMEEGLEITFHAGPRS